VDRAALSDGVGATDDIVGAGLRVAIGYDGLRLARRVAGYGQVVTAVTVL